MITGKTAIYALFGNPVGHSLSPQMHAGWFADAGLDAAYVALPIDPAQPQAALVAVGALGFAGANITVPFKEAAARAADRRTASVETLGVANTFVREGDEIVAHNTDVAGLIGALDEGAPGWRTQVKSALVLGAGGAATACAFGLIEAGCAQLIIANRTLSRAEDLAGLAAGWGKAQAVAVDWEDLGSAFAGADLIVNGTSLGMKGAAEPNWPMDRAKSGTIVFDAVYAPLETGLLRAARARGLTAIDGLGMLIHQGVAAFALWTGITSDAASARARLLAAIAARGG